MRLVPRRGLGDALTALLRRERLHQQMGRADEPRLHRRGRLARHQRIHQGLSEAATELGQGCGQDPMGLGVIRVDLAEATSVPHCHLGAQALTHVCIGLPPRGFEPCQGHQPAGRDRRPAPRGTFFGKTPGQTLRHCLDHGLPRQGIGPLAYGVGGRDERGGLEVDTPSGAPVLQIASDTPGRLSFFIRGARVSGYNETRVCDNLSTGGIY